MKVEEFYFFHSVNFWEILSIKLIVKLMYAKTNTPV
jgi:hypothetical protein